MSLFVLWLVLLLVLLVVLQVQGLDIFIFSGAGMELLYEDRDVLKALTPKKDRTRIRTQLSMGLSHERRIEHLLSDSSRCEDPGA